MRARRSSIGRLGPRRTACLLSALAATACLAPPPPIVVETPFGAVHAETQGTATEVAAMLEDLAPRVKALLPGSQDRSIDVWVQDELRVYRYHTRPESVRGFTLLAEEFRARRIHLQEDGQSPWYLAHELVHALIGEGWATLPGILEEGLADVIAEELNEGQRVHIRAHRLLNATAFSDGIELELAYRVPDGLLEPDASEGRRILPESAPELRRRLVLRLSESVPASVALELLATDRSRLHSRWPEIPEAYYGLAWLIVSRIHERSGLTGLFELCTRAAEARLALVPPAWLLEAAEIDLDTFDSAFLATCFSRDEFQRAIYLRPEAFAEAAIQGLRPLDERLDTRELFYLARPAFVLPDGGRVQLSTIGPLREEMRARAGTRESR